ncbi:uncharacterized protein LOC118409213 [Branchiostoma floridae]|uniref:Uncharacterized protein LOC118409213 n=1 Tax=Branchiostoma floridae TaxID=7739 RepID=A0A9J7HWJ5_BRAFL|nr:uncharacterized protein LOC118409213 [Branchiostoma floridae]
MASYVILPESTSHVTNAKIAPERAGIPAVIADVANLFHQRKLPGFSVTANWPCQQSCSSVSRRAGCSKLRFLCGLYGAGGASSTSLVPPLLPVHHHRRGSARVQARLRHHPDHGSRRHLSSDLHIRTPQGGWGAVEPPGPGNPSLYRTRDTNRTKGRDAGRGLQSMSGQQVYEIQPAGGRGGVLIPRQASQLIR